VAAFIKTSAEELEKLEAILLKARRRLSDEAEDPDEEGGESLDDQGFREFDPDAEGDDADKWLEANDPQKDQEEDDDEEPNDEDEIYDEYGPDEDEDAHQQLEAEGDQPTAEAGAPSEAGGAEGSPESDPDRDEAQVQDQEEPAQEVSEGRFPQPSKEDMAEMRQYTRPWEQRARETTRLQAEPQANPVLHHEGQMVEARNTGHKAHQDAYAKFQASPDYQNADPVSQMEMDTKFDQDWHKNNPEYLSNAQAAHEQAHQKGLHGRVQHANKKMEDIEHVRQGGAQPDAPMSLEEGMQHAGGTKGEEGTEGSTVQDPAASFAAANQDFLREKGGEHADRASKQKATAEKLINNYQKKLKKPMSADDMHYDKDARADMHRILGDHPALKDPAKKAKVDSFFEKYHPLIGMNAKKVVNKLGLDPQRGGNIDMSAMHEAGMHGLMQAINDYDHENPGKANFATHAGHKIRGLMQTALRDQDKNPQGLKLGAKKYNLSPERADRMKRIQTFKQIHVPKAPKPEGGSGNEQQ